MKSEKKYDLEERLIEFACLIIEIVNLIQRNIAGSHLAGQLVRSGTSSALHYGEAQSGESRRDFIHKMKICLKELRETLVSLKIIKRAKLCRSELKVKEAIEECNELIAIFVKSIQTAEKKR
jgi:four helix bundle protein